VVISKEEVRHIAELARLRLSPEEVVRYQSDLSSILEYIEQLKQIDTAGIDPTTMYASGENTLREDTVGCSLSVDDALANAPARVNNMFSVPKVIDD